MSDDDYMMLVVMFIGMLLWVAKLQWTVRRLKRQVALPAAATPVALPAVPAPAPALMPAEAADKDELARLRQRLEVLERITVEKENSLSREIEALRGR